MSHKILSFLGLAVMVGIAYLLSSDRKKINWKTVGVGIGLQIFFGFIILKLPVGRIFFDGAKEAFNALLAFTQQGSNFLFGSLANNQSVGFVFATMVLPTIIFFSSFMSILYHVGIMQKVVEAIAKFMVRFMGTSGSESIATAANIFVGQTEAPLVVKPYVETMTRSELMALMSGGMATVAGGVFAAYIGFGIDAGHLLAASVMSAPAALVCAKLMVVESEQSMTAGKVELRLPKTASNFIEAAANGAGEGLTLALNVGAMLLAFIALIAMLNGIIGWTGNLIGYPNLSFELIMGYIFSPFAFIMGVPSEDVLIVGSMLGKKLVLNEFVAYLDLKENLTTLKPRSITIATYALCGFANFSSIAIQLGGIGSIAPSRKSELAKLGMKALIAGTLACFMTACIAGIFI